MTDTGIGIDKADMVRVFEPFFTTKEMGRGTGLGLASVYGIIKGHGGHINVYSEKGRGTTFTIYLPASAREVDADVRNVPATVQKGHDETVLLMDDEEMIIDVGRGLLAELGYTVLVARSGSEALEMYRQNAGRIDIVIMDMIMPGLGGGEVFDRLKRINPQREGAARQRLQHQRPGDHEIIERGCDGFMQKPFTMMQLSAKMREILGKKGVTRVESA